MSYRRRRGHGRGGAAARRRRARCRPGRRSAGAGRRGTPRAPPARPARPCVSPKLTLRSGSRLGQEDAPAVVLHRHPVEVRPAVAADRDRRAQVDVVGRDGRAEVLPPVEELRLPALERPLQLAVAGQVDVVRDLLAVVDLRQRAGGRRGLAGDRAGLGAALGRGGGQSSVRPASCRSRPADRCRTGAVRRRGQRRSGGWKIQFCQAVSRPKTLVSGVSGPAKRRLASMPVSASGEKLAALLDDEADLVRPVDVVRGAGDQAELEGASAASRSAPDGGLWRRPARRRWPRKRTCRRERSLPIGSRPVLNSSSRIDRRGLRVVVVLELPARA